VKALVALPDEKAVQGEIAAMDDSIQKMRSPSEFTNGTIEICLRKFQLR